MIKKYCGIVIDATYHCGDRLQGMEGDCICCDSCRTINDAEILKARKKEVQRIKNRARRERKK